MSKLIASTFLSFALVAVASACCGSAEKTASAKTAASACSAASMTQVAKVDACAPAEVAKMARASACSTGKATQVAKASSCCAGTATEVAMASACSSKSVTQVAKASACGTAEVTQVAAAGKGASCCASGTATAGLADFQGEPLAVFDTLYMFEALGGRESWARVAKLDAGYTCGVSKQTMHTVASANAQTGTVDGQSWMATLCRLAKGGDTLSVSHDAEGRLVVSRDGQSVAVFTLDNEYRPAQVAMAKKMTSCCGAEMAATSVIELAEWAPQGALYLPARVVVDGNTVELTDATVELAAVAPEAVSRG